MVIIYLIFQISVVGYSLLNKGTATLGLIDPLEPLVPDVVFQRSLKEEGLLEKIQNSVFKAMMK